MANDDIFKEALGMFEERTEKPKKEVEKRMKVITTEMAEKKLKAVKTWDDLKEAIDGEHAERFNTILRSLPPAQFMTHYLKVIEFFKPKIVRSDGSEEKEKDHKIEIQIKKSS